MWGLNVIVFFCIVATPLAKSADFEPCPSDDKDCLIKVFNVLYEKCIEGEPSSNIDSLDPMHHEEVEGDLATLKYNLTKSTIDGFKDCKIVNAAIPMDQTSMHLELNCPFFDVHGTYVMDGKILALPIQGKGDYHMECKDYQIVLDSKLKDNEDDGKKYLSIKSYTYSGQLKGGMIDLKNLFNGQKELADTVLKVLNENWTTVATELQGPVMKANVKKIIKNFNKYLKFHALSKFIA